MTDQHDDKAREIVARELAAYYVSPRPQDPGSEPFDLRAAIADALRDAAEASREEAEARIEHITASRDHYRQELAASEEHRSTLHASLEAYKGRVEGLQQAIASTAIRAGREAAQAAAAARKEGE